MKKLLHKTLQLSRDVNGSDGHGTRRYWLISDFGKSFVASESGCVESYFRIFTPVRPERGRKLNPCYYSSSGSDFNKYKDTLMDYPTIVQNKLGKEPAAALRDYNRLVSLHTSRCPLDCWHCYVDECLRSTCSNCHARNICNGDRRVGTEENWFTAKQIVDGFIRQQEADNKNALKSNILRITGGEPFLVPDLILEVLIEIERRGLNTEIFLWTETNLIPFVELPKSEPLIRDEYLKELARFKNFCVHPCFHGLDKTNFKDVTGQKISKYEYLIDGFKRLINAKIDVYPTFGANIVPSCDIEHFYNQIASINELLPLRFCLIEYDLDYKTIKWRRNNFPKFNKIHEKVYDRYLAILIWDDLLYKNTGHHYAEIPRHEIAL